MKRLLLFGILLQFEMYFGLDTKLRGEITPQLYNLGQVEGKLFFAEETGHDWNSCLEFCESQGLNLATIETVGQRDFLRSKNNGSYFTSGHWTAGRDSYEPRQMSWHYTTQSVPNEFADSLLNSTDYRSCMIFCPNCGVTSQFRIVPCAASYYCLCHA